MADRYQSDDRSRRGRTQRGYGEQAEQFQSDYNDERSRQMGESWRDDDSQQSSWQSDERDERDRRLGRDYRASSTDRYGNERFGTAGYGPSRYTPGGGRSFSSFTGNDYGGGDFAGGAGTYGHERAPIGGERAYGRGSYGEGSWGSGTYGAGSWLGANHGEWRDRDFGSGRGYARDRSYGGSRGDDRGFFERAGDAVARWFGDDEGSGRQRESYRGHGPANYTRTDERIREDASERLTDDWSVDARKIEVKVSNGEITLDGTVTSRDQKRRAEDLVEDLSGVKHVQNNLRVDEGSRWDRNNSGETSASGSNKTTSSI
ncbi:MAG TPA: BON domain-containing protein [Croceibacterium sp.]|nr:BON domain-containing protein [Croceibacterium sp.]